MLAHGAVFNKESWDPLAVNLAEKGLRVLAIDFRGYGKSVVGSRRKAFYEDVLAGVHYLRREGAKTVSIVGGSMGGKAAAQAEAYAGAGEIDRLVLLSPMPIENPQAMKAGYTLFITARDELNAPRVQQQYDAAPYPKMLKLLDGKAHAQHMFKTEQAEALTMLIVLFLGPR